MASESTRPLPALLSQVLVAYTLELDNEFERRMRDAGYAGTGLSLVMWSTLLRFVAAGTSSIREIAKCALSSEKPAKFGVGCLERWGFVTLEPDSGDERPVPTSARRLSGRIVRDGWGSGRGIRSNWRVRPTTKGQKALEIWAPLFDEIEQRWVKRFGKAEISALRQSLEEIDAQLDIELPEAVPGLWDMDDATYAAGVPRTAGPLALPALLSHLLMAFTIEFGRESRVPLWLCANTLRVLGEQPIAESEIPNLTGCSPETSGIGWQMKPYIVLEADPARRGKLVRLSPRGIAAKETYRILTAAIEKRWEGRFGKQKVRRLNDSLLALFVPRSGERPLISMGLIPAEGTVRAGTQTPALGRRDVGAAARQRMRDCVAQTAMFLRDPAATLPHYPLWDMNRGFGP